MSGVIDTVIRPVFDAVIRGVIGGDGTSIIDAKTTDLAGTAEPNSITFTLTECLYSTATPTANLAQAFLYRLNGAQIDESVATFFPANNGDPMDQTWQALFAAGTIATARGSGADNWIDGDVLTVELPKFAADLMQVRPDCAQGSVDAGDTIASAIGRTTVDNLYNAPVLVSVTAISDTQLVAVFNVPVSDSNEGNPPYDPGAEMFNCTNDTVLPVVDVIGSGTTQLTYTYTDRARLNDAILWSVVDTLIGCELHDLLVGTDGGAEFGYLTPADVSGGYGNLTPLSGEFINVYQLIADTGANANIIRLGVNGDEKDAQGNDTIQVVFGGYGITSYDWNIANLRYELLDAALVTYVSNNLNETIRISAFGTTYDNLFIGPEPWVLGTGWTDDSGGFYTHVAGVASDLYKDLPTINAGFLYRFIYDQTQATGNTAPRVQSILGPSSNVTGDNIVTDMEAGARPSNNTGIDADINAGLTVSKLRVYDLNSFNIIPFGDSRDFVTSLGDWREGFAGRGTLSWGSIGQLLNLVNDQGGDDPIAVLNTGVSVVSGTIYSFHCEIKTVTALNNILRVTTDFNGDSLGELAMISFSATGYIVVTFTALVSGLVYLALQIDGIGITGDVLEVDNMYFVETNLVPTTLPT